jgi:hypothetical protein
MHPQYYRQSILNNNHFRGDFIMTKATTAFRAILTSCVMLSFMGCSHSKSSSLEGVKNSGSTKKDFYTELAKFKGKTLVAVDLTYNNIPSNINTAEVFDIKLEVAGGPTDVELKLDDNCSLVISKPAEQGQGSLPYKKKCKSSKSAGYSNSFRIYDTGTKAVFVSSEKEITIKGEANIVREQIKTELLAKFVTDLGHPVNKDDLLASDQFDQIRIENKALYLGTQYRSRTTTSMPTTIEFKLVEKK